MTFRDDLKFVYVFDLRLLNVSVIKLFIDDLKIVFDQSMRGLEDRRCPSIIIQCIPLNMTF